MMNTVEKRALYHLLRMNWLNDRTLKIETWQVEEYPALDLPILFERLKKFNIHLDRDHFISYADNCDSPEDLTDHLVGDRTLSPKQEDQIYLLIFELWRRLLRDKPSLSTLCYELDEQIFLYDQEKFTHSLDLQDALARFLHILVDNVDRGIDPPEALELISPFCANDIENFLYDYITKEIEEGNESYAFELLEGFNIYWDNNKWFKLLYLRLCEHAHGKIAQKLISEINEDYLDDQDVDYYLEYLHTLAVLRDPLTFGDIMNRTISLMQNEDDFQDLLAITINHFQRSDQRQPETTLKKMLAFRSNHKLEHSIDPNDPDLINFKALFNRK